MKLPWKKLPEQIRRLAVVSLFLVVLPFIVRSILVPSDFGKYGHYRASAVDEIIAMEIKYAGHQVCYDCHDEEVESKQAGVHKNVSCEICHGPAAAHSEDDEIELIAPRDRDSCPLCHEYLSSRPTGFPQIVSDSHEPMKACISCHDPHNPKSEKSTECEACHTEIANTKSLSKHVNIACKECHETPDAHKTQPRMFLPGKPVNREFCGRCHAETAPSDKDIPRIEMETHEEAYVCWQCHYPHLPEAE
ncbi:MAG: hypothetical protein DWQ05_06040 [Calditrichaeota bacterium]|nr:MAG: hypothetical protein DWQ05_06040 [Calditrichota bacterium]